MRSAKPPPKPDLGTRLRIPPGGYARVSKEVAALAIQYAAHCEAHPGSAESPTGKGMLRQFERVETAMKIELQAEEDLGPEYVEL